MNNIICKICNFKFINNRQLLSHIKIHKITSHEYYDLYIKTEIDGLCLQCNKITIFRGFKYTKFCCLSCASKFNKNGGDKNSLLYLSSKYDINTATHKYTQRINNAKLSHLGKCYPNKKPNSIESKIKTSNTLRSRYNTNKTPYDPYKIKDKCPKIKSNNPVYTLSWFIDKYGIDIGTIKYNQRCSKISETSHFKTYNKTNRMNYSLKSQKLFWELYNILNLYTDIVYFAELNHEYSCGTNSNFDFVIVNTKKVIEFNGSIWHANPKYFQPESFMKNCNMLAKDVWLKDTIKNNKAIAKGFNILTIWESDYDCNKKDTIQKCIKFLTMDQ